MKKAYLFEKRKKAKKLRQKGWTITKIARYLVAGRRHVSKWINKSDEKLERDNRGWKKGKLRKYTNQQKEEIKNIRTKLEKEESYFIGAKVVHANYNNSHDDKVQKDL